MLFIIPVLLALAVIGVFVLNELEIITIEKMDTRLGKIILVLSFLLMFAFVIWFVFRLIPPESGS